MGLIDDLDRGNASRHCASGARNNIALQHPRGQAPAVFLSLRLRLNPCPVFVSNFQRSQAITICMRPINKFQYQFISRRGVAAVALAVSLAFTPAAHAQEMPRPQLSVAPLPEPSSRGGIFFNPLALAFGLISAEGVFGATETLAFTVNGAFWSLSSGDISLSAYGLGVGLMYFPRGKLFQGLYFAPSLQFAQANVASFGDEASATLVGPRGIVGYHWDWHPFALKLGGGAQYYAGNVTGDDIDISIQGASLAIDASIGFTWR